MLINEEIRYPEETTILFKETGDIKDLACAPDLMQQFGSYADGYQTGALKLIDRALSSSSSHERDELLYPIVFLLRHYIELRLKELIQALNYCLKRENNFPTGHNLDFLWRAFKYKYEELGEDVSSNHFHNMTRLMNELHEFDPLSMAFRYPVDKDGLKTQKVVSLNLVNLKDTFIRMSFMFDGISMQLAHYVDITNEMISDRYDDYYGN